MGANQRCAVERTHKRTFTFDDRFRNLLWPTISHYSKRLVIPTVYAQAPNVHDVATESVETTPKHDGSSQVLVSDEEVKEYLACETGSDRLRAMFLKTNSGQFSDELNLVSQVTTHCALMCAFVTSMLGGWSARDKFVRKNKHVKYDTKFLAVRAYNDAIVFGTLKFGLKWGAKTGVFAGIFMLTSQSVAVYRNKTSIVDYIAGGGVTCALLRMNVGLRGMFAGGVIGSALGLACGMFICTLIYAANETQQQRHYRSIHTMLQEKRDIKMLVAGAEGSSGTVAEAA